MVSLAPTAAAELVSMEQREQQQRRNCERWLMTLRGTVVALHGRKWHVMCFKESVTPYHATSKIPTKKLARTVAADMASVEALSGMDRLQPAVAKLLLATYQIPI